MEQKRPTSSFVIPKKRRVEVETPPAPVIPEGYEIRPATSSEQSSINEQLMSCRSKSQDRNAACEDGWKSMQPQKIEMIVNARLEHSFKTYKKRTNITEETLGFRVAFDRQEVVSIAQNGLRVGCDSLADIGNPAKGVVVYNSPALANPSRFLYANTSITILGFRTVRGKALGVKLNSGKLEPSSKHNCHVPLRTEQEAKNSHPLVLDHRLGAVYHYEYLPNGKDVQKFPTSLVPYFVATFKLSDNPPLKAGKIHRPLSHFEPNDGGFHRLKLGTLEMKTYLLIQNQLHKLSPYIINSNDIIAEPVMMEVSSADDFPELRALRTSLYGRLLLLETVEMDIPNMERGIASYQLARLPEKGIVRTLWKKKVFFIWKRDPWKVFYIPSGDFAAEFGFPYMSETMHLIIYRRDHIESRNYFYVGTDQERTVNWTHANTYSLSPKNPVPKDMEMIVAEEIQEEEIHAEPVSARNSSIDIDIPIHPSLSRPPGPSIVRGVGVTRTNRVTFKENLEEVKYFDSGSPEHRPPDRQMSFAEKRKKDQLTEQQLKEKEVIDADFKSAMTGKQRSASEDGEPGQAPRPVTSSLSVPPPQQSAPPRPHGPPFFIPPGPQPVPPPPRLPANFNMPPPMVRGPAPPMDPRIGPFSMPPPGIMPLPPRNIPHPDFSKPPPSFIPLSTPSHATNIPPPTIVMPPPISVVPVVPVVPEVPEIPVITILDDDEEIGEAPMDMSLDEKEEEEKEAEKIVEQEKEKVEEVPAEEPPQEDDDDNDILKMAFSQAAPQSSEPSLSTSDLLATLSSLNPETVKMLRSKDLSKSAEESADTDLRAPSASVTFSIQKAKPIAKPNANVLGDDEEEEEEAPTEGAKDIDYRKPIEVMKKLKELAAKNKDHDDRPRDIDDRIPPKDTSISDANRKKAFDSLQGKLRANGKDIDNRIQSIMNLPDSMLSSNNIISVIAPSLLNCNIGPNGLVMTAAKAQPEQPPPQAPESPEPEQIRSPSPMDDNVPHVDTFLNQQKCVIVPTESKEGYSTFRGEPAPSTSELSSKKAAKKHAKFPRDHDSVFDSKTSDKKATDSWNNLMNKSRPPSATEKTGKVDKEDGELNSDDETRSTPSSSAEGLAPNKTYLRYPPGIARGSQRGRGQFPRPPIIPIPPAQYFQRDLPPVNFFNRGPLTPRGLEYLDKLAPVSNPNAANYSIFIDPDLTTGTIKPTELDSLFRELSNLKKRRDDDGPIVHATVYMHSSIQQVMSNNKHKEVSKFFHTFHTYRDALVETMPQHTCDFSVAPKVVDLADCMVKVNQKKGGKEVIFITHNHKTDSEVHRTMTARNIKVLRIREFARLLCENEGVKLYV